MTATRRRFAAALLATTAICWPGFVAAQVTPADAATKAYEAPNGVPVVDIAGPNGAGLSHNRFTDYNVDSRGLVLNNGGPDQITRTSQLAGQITANLNLTQSATVILNEVVGPNRSRLAGFTEILGGKADLIVANPYGITCEGCGFLNTGALTLTTGRPTVGADGRLLELRVTGGDITIAGAGLDASGQDYLALVSRKLVFNGQVNAKALDGVAGTGTWSYGGRTWTAGPGEGTAPDYAIDSTVLGGLYAGRIRLLATDAGVGVRAAGAMGATAGDFDLTAAGRIELTGRVSAEGDLKLVTGGASAALTLTDAQVSARRDVRLDAGAGQATIAGGLVTAGRDLSVTAGALTDTATTAASTDNNSRYATGSSTITLSDSAVFSGTAWGAGGRLGLVAGSLRVGDAGATIYGGTVDLSTTDFMALNTAAVGSTGSLDLASGGLLTTTAGDRQGVVSTSGDLRIASEGGFANAGSVSATTGGVALNVRGALNNTGLLHAAGDLSLAGTEAGRADLNNSGRVLTSARLFLNTGVLSNAGVLQAATGGRVDVQGLFDNDGTLTLGLALTDAGSVAAGRIDNDGTLQGFGDLGITFVQGADNAGRLLAGGDLGVSATGDAAATFLNEGAGVVQAGGGLRFDDLGAARRLTLRNMAGGRILAGSADWSLASLDNAGAIQTDSVLVLDAAGAAVNSGTLLVRGALDLDAASFNNTGGLQADLGGAIRVGTATNSGTLVLSTASGADGAISATVFTNAATGTVQSADALTLTLSDGLTNRGKVLAGGDLIVAAAEASRTLAVVNEQSAALQAGGVLRVIGTGTATNTTFAQSGLALGNTVETRTQSLTNAGTLQSTGAMSLTATSLTNTTNAKLISGGALDLSATTLTNSGGLQGRDTNGSVTTLNNTGLFIASTDAARASSLTLTTLDNGGTLQGAGALALNIGQTLTNTGLLLSNADLTIAGRNGGTLSVRNRASGVIKAGGELDIRSAAGQLVSVTDQSGLLWGRTLDILLPSLTNLGTVRSDLGGTVAVTGTLSNESAGRLLVGTEAGAVGRIAARVINNDGLIQSASGLTLAYETDFVNRTTGRVLSGAALTLEGGTAAAAGMLENSGRIQATGALTARAATGAPVGDLRQNTGGVFVGGSVTATLDEVRLADGTGITAGGALNLSARTLTLAGQNAFVVAGDDAPAAGVINLSQAFSNPGFVFSGGDLTLTAPQVTNSTTGGLAANGTLRVTTAGGNISNSGAIYAGTLAALSGVNVSNLSGGTIDSDQDATVTASGQFLNNYEVNVGRDLTISAATFVNSVVGGDNRRWNWFGTGFDGISTGVNPGDFDQANRTGANSGDTSGVLGWTERLDSSDTEISGDRTDRYSATFYTEQSYVGGAPTHKPLLLANRTLTITGFTSGSNIGAIISAPTVNIYGGSFLNDDLSLLRYRWQARWNHYRDCDSPGIGCDWTYYRSYQKGVVSTETISSFGAGVFAGTLNVNVSGLTNAGSPFGAVVQGSDKSGAGTSALDATGGTVTGATGLSGASGVTGSGGVAGVTGVNGQPAVQFGGLTISLPSSPNGRFVTSQDPNAKFLVETNPRFTGGAGGVGSDYLAQRLGVNPDTLQRRLGDATYETYLITQQIAAQTGAAALNRGETAQQQAQRLMEQAATQASELGLVLGKAPTPEQLAGLKQDIVWLVETEVAGQKVLAPVVYLSAATKTAFAGGGAVLAGNDVNLRVDSLTNTGGTIQGSDTLAITATGDVTNTSGAITGGNVSVVSTGGSIVNQTTVVGGGGAVGNTATIQATGNLTLDAAQNITNLGAQVSAGGNANLTAGGNVTFDTIQQTTSSESQSGRTSTSTTSTTQIGSGLTVGGDLGVKAGNDVTFGGTTVSVGGNATLDAGRDINIVDRQNTTTTSTSSSSGTILNGTTSTSTTTTGASVGSTFNVGGNLTSTSGGDTTLRGSQVNVGGNADVTTGGNLNILAGQNTTQTTSTTTEAGAGVGGGVYGATVTQTETFSGRNVASGLNVGGNLSTDVQGTMTVQGSNVNVGGNADIKAGDVQILQGNDVDRSSTTTTTTTFLRVDDGSSENSSQTNAGADAGVRGQTASASAEAGASTQNNSSGGVEFSNTTVTQTDSLKQTAVGSSINVGGNTNIQSAKDVTLQGSTITSGGNVDIKAQNVNVLAAENKDITTTTTTSVSIGLMAESENKAGASAGASASASATAGAQAGAQAGASSDNTVDVVRGSSTTTTDTTITYTGSGISAGGNLSLDAANQLRVQGSELSAGGDVDLKAKDMSFEAVQEVRETTTSTTSMSAGLYTTGEANAQAGAEVGMTGASAGASADAEVSSGFQIQSNVSNSTEGSTTAKTSSIKAGGSINREAEGKITDVGTQIEAGGDFTQKATEYESKAAADTTYSSSDSMTDTLRVGGYADAEAGASAGAGAGGGTGASAGASAGVKVGFEHDQNAQSSASSTAVTTSIKAGGNVSSTTTGKTSLEGTNIEAGGNVGLTAGSLDFKAAENTQTSSSSNTNVNAEVKVGVDVTKAVKVGVEAGYEGGESQSSSSQAVTGGIKAGGNLTVTTTTGDANFQGTKLEAGGTGTIDSAGSVNFDAARDTSSSSSSSQNVSASVNTSKASGGGGSAGVGVEGGYEQSKSQSSTAVTGGITTGGGLTVKAGNDVNLEGTGLNAGGDATISAGGNVNMKAAESTSSSEGFSVQGGLSGEMEKSGGGQTGSATTTAGGSDKPGDTSKTGGANVEAGYEASSSTTYQGSTVSSGGKVTINAGGNVAQENTTVNAQGGTTVQAGGTVTTTKKEDKSSEIAVQGSLKGETTSANADQGTTETGVPTP